MAPSAADTGLQVTHDGVVYAAEEVAHGAAYELFSTEEVDGFQRNPRPGSAFAWHRFVHVTEVTAVQGARDSAEVLEAPLMIPLNRARGWHDIHALSQTPAYAHDPTVAGIRRTAAIRRGTRMIKVLSARQLSGYLRGWLPYGFCYREHDVAHLRTPADLALLRTDADAGRDNPDVIYALRWRAADLYDFEIPLGDNHRGLGGMPAHDRVGPPVLGTGFTPSGRHIIPEFVTTDLADLPLPANATLLAYTPDGTEVVLYTYQPEQRGWLRMVGPQWRHLLAGVPDIAPDQEYVPSDEKNKSTRLVGRYRGQEYEAVADPPGEFRVLAMTRAARYPVEALSRRGAYARWRGVDCMVLRQESGWTRLRMCRPDSDGVAALGAQCYERGIYEAWAPAAEITDHRMVDIEYVLT
ncbi:hypothetical protein Prum_048370 [Phytohabitans rumicis]|uniref:Uncharacterized protein n=1 Tax=Phytohabitans rumicis TaxID=1076125 RepID=A0A6V8LEX3_9ACTN|nr:hypothetical protein Prum_048370 [Phytohabitans rumicis]